MKKVALLALCALMVLTGVFIFSGCNEGDVTGIQFKTKPADTYYKGEGEPKFVLSVTIKGKDDPEEITYPGTDTGITVEGFSNATVGTFTATVKYDDFALEFTYSVIEKTSEFAGGTGSAQEPYLISNFEQFQNMLNKVNVKHYYKLTADIDFSGKTVKQPAYDNNGAGNYFTAEIDGNGYSLLNVDDIDVAVDPDKSKISKMNELFGQVGDFKLKNITVNFASTGSYSVTGLVTSGFGECDVVFENVKTTGFIDAVNCSNTSIGVFVMQAQRRGNHTTTFVNCTNETNVLNSTMIMYVSGFANTQSENAQISFEDCVNKGKIEGANTACAGFVVFTKSPAAVTFKNCSNEGTVIKTVANTWGAGQIFASVNEDIFNSFVATGATESGDLDVTISSIDASYDKGAKKLAFSIDESLSDSVSYFKVIHIGGVEYKTGGTGVLVYNEKVDKVHEKLSYEYVVKELRFVSDGEAPEKTTDFGNPNIGLIGDQLVYDDTALATGVKGPSSIIVFAYDEAHKPIAVSAKISLE